MEHSARLSPLPPSRRERSSPAVCVEPLAAQRPALAWTVGAALLPAVLLLIALAGITAARAIDFGLVLLSRPDGGAGAAGALPRQ